MHPGIIRARCVMRSLFRPVQHQPRAYRAQRQSRRMFASLPPALHAGRPPRPHRRLRQAFAVDERQRPERQPARLDRGRHPLLQDRRALQGHGDGEERHRPLPQPAGPPDGAPPRAGRHQRRALQLRLHARPRTGLQPRRHRLLRQRPQGRHRRLRHPQARRRRDRRRAARQGAGLRGGAERGPAAPQQRRADLVGPPGRAAGRAGQHRHARRGFRGQALAGRTQSAAGSELRRAEGPVPGTELFRNRDMAWERRLAKPSAWANCVVAKARCVCRNWISRQLASLR